MPQDGEGATAWTGRGSSSSLYKHKWWKTQATAPSLYKLTRTSKNLFIGWYHWSRTTEVSNAPHRNGPPELAPSAVEVDKNGSGSLSQGHPPSFQGSWTPCLDLTDTVLY